VVEFYDPSTLTPQGAKALGAAFNKKHRLSVTLDFNPAGSICLDFRRILGNAAL